MWWSDVEPLQISVERGVVSEGVGVGTQSQVEEERGGGTGRLRIEGGMMINTMSITCVWVYTLLQGWNIPHSKENNILFPPKLSAITQVESFVAIGKSLQQSSTAKLTSKLDSGQLSSRKRD